MRLSKSLGMRIFGVGFLFCGAAVFGSMLSLVEGSASLWLFNAGWVISAIGIVIQIFYVSKSLKDRDHTED